MSTKLRLGPLPATDTIKVTLTLPAALHADLQRYTQLHAEAWGQSVDVARLIPHMLETFMVRDRAFRKSAG